MVPDGDLECPPPGPVTLGGPFDGVQLSCRNFVLGEDGVPAENNVGLSWNPATGAEMYDVYFGAGEASLEKIATTTGFNWPVAVDCSKAYAWKVVAKNDCGPESSTVWQFQMLACTDSFPEWECFPPIADFTLNPERPVAGQPVQVNDETEQAREFLWNFGDGRTDPIEDVMPAPVHVFTAAGDFEVELRIKNPVGSASISKSVHVVPSSPLSLTAPYDGFIGEPLVLEALAQGCVPAENGWIWDLADGEAVGPATGPVVSARWPSTGRRVVVVRNSACGDAVASWLVNIYLRIPISGPTAAHVGEPVELSATVPADPVECAPVPPGGPQFYWTVDASTGPGPNPKTIVWDSPGRHFVEVFVDNCSRAYGTHEVLVGDWIALGDSYSSGEGAGVYLAGTDSPGQNMCHRSDTAYSGITRDLLDTADEFFACSGAESVNVIHTDYGGTPKCFQDEDPPYVCSQTYVAPDDVPQLDHPEMVAANLITITIGGNDAQFGNVLKLCYEEDDCEHFKPHGWTETLGEALPEMIALLEFQLEATLEAIAVRAPFAEVRVLGYPALFPSEARRQACPPLADPSCYGFWSPQEQTWLNSLVPVLNHAIAMAAANLGARFISVEDAFSGHEICGPQGSWFVPPPTELCLPYLWSLWTSGVSPEYFHPTPTGHREGYRRALEADLQAVPVGSASALRPPGLSGQSSSARKRQAQAAWASSPTLGELHVKVIAPACGELVTGGQEVAVSGVGFAPGAAVSLILDAPDPQVLKLVSADTAGRFGTTVTVPIGVSPTVMASLQAAGTGANLQPRALIAHFTIGPGLGVDQDGDGIPDACDNCPSNFNAEQTDSDGDFRGDACDTCPDSPVNGCFSGSYFTVAPCRIADTRSTELPALTSTDKRLFPIAGRCGIPASAKAVSVNVTVAGATGRGYVQAWPSDVQQPGSSIINFSAGQTRANNSILALSNDGIGDVAVQAFVVGGGTVHLIIDVNGYFK